MKSGNLYSELLDNFTANYAKVAQMILSQDSEHTFKNIQLSTGYNDFFDKFARKESQNIVKSKTFRFLTTESDRDNYHCELSARVLTEKIEN